jgi:hypothetical protein
LLFKSRVRSVAVFGLIVFLSAQCSVVAQVVPESSSAKIDGAPSTGAETSLNSGRMQCATTKDSVPIVAQANGANTASEVADVAVVGAYSGKKKKYELLITDSLWGNLILDMAYQRDPELRKIAKRLNIVNFGTMAAITGIAGGTLAQGIIALSVLNPPPPKLDSYQPGAIGVGMSGLTIVTFMGRAVFNNVLSKKMRERQLAIKHKVESILTQLEATHGENPEAQTDLIALIGERATNEWLQLWRSSNVVATMKLPNISLTPSLTPAAILGGGHL